MTSLIDKLIKRFELELAINFVSIVRIGLPLLHLIAPHSVQTHLNLLRILSFAVFHRSGNGMTCNISAFVNERAVQKYYLIKAKYILTVKKKKSLPQISITTQVGVSDTHDHAAEFSPALPPQP